MRRRHEAPSGSQAEREDMESMPGSTGSTTGATSTGMQETGTYQQPGYQQGYQQSQATTSYGQPTPSRPGAALSILAGALAFLAGLAFVIRAHFYHTTVGYAYRWTLHGWGWVLLVLGALLIAGGVSHFLGIRGSRQFAATMAVLTAVVAFLTIFYSVVWGIVVVAASAFAAYSLLSDRGDTMGDGGGGQAYGDTGRRGAAMSQGKR
jgi:cation transport ATPase